jgi:hypothetical protein
MDIKQHLKTYMMNYPDSFVGFLWSVADVLKSLGQEWADHGKKEWGDIFTSSGNQVLEIAANLASIRDEYNKEQQIEDDAKAN